MYANPEPHALVLIEAFVQHLEYGLDLDRAGHGLGRSRELGQHVVSSEIDHAPATLAHEDRHLLAVLSDRVDGRGLVLGHQSAVADHVGAQNRGESTFGLHAGIVRQSPPARGSRMERTAGGRS